MNCKPRVRLGVLVAVLLPMGWEGWAQERVVPALPAGTIPPIPPLSSPASSATNPPANPASTNQVSPAEQRLADLLKLSFDRSHRAVLQVLARQAEGGPAPTNELQRFRADVLSGQWLKVGQFLESLPTEHRDKVYNHLLTQLQQTPQPGMQGGPGQPGRPPADEEGLESAPPIMIQPGMPPGMMLSQAFWPDDVLALADLAPAELTGEQAESLGRLLGKALGRGNDLAPILARLETGTAKIGGTNAERRALAGRLLIASGRMVDAGKFLPDLEVAAAKGEWKNVDLHARYWMALGQQRNSSNSPAHFQKAWELTQTILNATNTTPRERDPALLRCFDLLSEIPRATATNWMRSCFVDRPALGMRILAQVGTLVQTQSINRDAETRARHLDMQDRAVKALLSVQPKPDERWRKALNVLALGWVYEAEQSRQRWQPPRQNYQQYDQFGNLIYQGNPYGYQQPQDPNQIPPIAPERLIATAPGQAWLSVIEVSLVPKIIALRAGLQLKTPEELDALPIIEDLAGVQPKLATELAADFLRAWARRRNPNSNTDYMGPRYYSPYSSMGNSTGTSLTRAHQVRNLKELAGILERLRRQPGLKLDDQVLVSAFTEAHSNAEVFRVEDIEMVFGPLGGIQSERLQTLLQSMRTRLAGQWRQPRVQQEAKTRRTDKEIEAEVMRGYELITALTQQAIERAPKSWTLRRAHGAALFDWAEFDYGKKVDLAIYTAKRDGAFASFRQAAQIYASTVPQLPEPEWSAEIYVDWFNSLLGASDLAYLTRQTEPSTNHLDEIRMAIMSLPADQAEKHMGLFGRRLNESANQIKPELKPRYLRAGLRVVGDDPSAAEVRRLVTYYDDLLAELTLDVRVDGDSVVGHNEPFGVFVSIQHSTAVSREAGGFAKYLQNQGNQSYYYNPYGGGPVNYRDNFEKQVREKFSPTFEILSIAFHDEKVEPRGLAGKPSWRETPYAYLLLKAKDAATDRLPALQIDMDFQDQRGMVILPITSQVQWIDARPDRAPRRPVEKVEIVQTLDARPARKGQVTLELKTSANGLLPSLREIFDLNVPGLSIDKFSEPALAITKLDADGDQVAAVVERSVLLTLRPEKEGAFPPTFQFPRPRLTGKQVFKRYADADVVEVSAEVALAGLSLRATPWWRWPLAGLVGLVILLAGRRWLPRSATSTAVVARYTVPQHISPFTVLALLKRIEADASVPLPPERRSALAQLIRSLEQAHFSPAPSTPPSNLEQLAQEWVKAVA